MRRFLYWLIKKPGYHLVPDIYGRSAAKMMDIREDATFKALADEARSGGRTLLYYDRLYTLYQALVHLSHRNEKKLRILEVGVYKGGGSYFMASVLQKVYASPVEQYAVDTFEGHSTKDLPQGVEGGHVPEQFNETSFKSVSEYLSKFNFVTVVKGRIQDTISQIGGTTFNLVHLDVDIYEPTLFGLETFGTTIAPGGVIVVDDYGFVTCPGVKKAVGEYLQKNPGIFFKFELPTGQCLLVKQ